MKLRIIEVFDASCTPWFRLQELRNNVWQYINGDSEIKFLEKQAERMLNHVTETILVVKEFDSEAQPFVDNSKTGE